MKKILILWIVAAFVSFAYGIITIRAFRGQCRRGFYLTQNYCCRRCMANCLECDNRRTCNKCDDGFSFDPSLSKCQREPVSL